MANFEKFSRQEIPYGILEKFGLTQEMIDDLPENVMNRFLSSRATPVLPIVTENAEGEKISTLARVSLVRMTDGTVDACFAPQWEDKDLTTFTQEQQEKLLLGAVITAQLPDKVECFVQFDDVINQVMAVPVEIIRQNISILSRSYGLDETDKANLEEGNVVEIKINENTVSVGIDLNEMTGLRIVNGNIVAWQEDMKADRLPKYNFGLYGCWMADDDNVLSYVTEENFSPELIAEQERAQAQNGAQAQMNQLKI